MHGPQPLALVLSDQERDDLTRLIRCHSTPQQLGLRARIVLGAADGFNNAQLARQCAVSLDLVRRWRARWSCLQAIAHADLSVTERLTDLPRPGKPAQLTAEQICHIVALACEPPAQSNRPVSQWTAREIAAEIIQRGIVPTISPRHAARVLKRGISNRI